VVVVLVALLIPASASAAKRYVGEFEDGGKVRFKVVKQRDGDKVVKRFKWSKVPITCSDGVHTTTSKPFDTSMKVRRKSSRFRILLVSRGVDTRIGVTGKLRGRRERKATGFITADGRIRHDDGVGQCSTGKAKWHAKRVY
jgi:hypothetical protein